MSKDTRFKRDGDPKAVCSVVWRKDRGGHVVRVTLPVADLAPCGAERGSRVAAVRVRDGLEIHPVSAGGYGVGSPGGRVRDRVRIEIPCADVGVREEEIPVFEIGRNSMVGGTIVKLPNSMFA